MEDMRKYKSYKLWFFYGTNKVLADITMDIPVNVSSNLKGKGQRGMK